MSTLELATTLFDRPGREPTLDEVISGAWEVLTARQAVECPVCGGIMMPRHGERAPAGGRCGDCGSTIT
jgi:ribosomal protein S27AE